MIRQLSHASSKEAKAILDIQIPAYQVEAKQINNSSIPRLYDTVQDIQNCNETFYGYFSENELTGFISFIQEELIIDIHRLVVSPRYFQKGIATKLLIHLFHIHPHVKKYIVQTGKANTPALLLYKKHGFTETQEIPLPDGLILTSLQKTEKNK
ncbi:GNAT family N-acetyltransferase [Bacillus sp. DX4.1]|uniref:GNAT family N-acetyltransferase n=1 Tax=Bacillus sp. DX4.1 TaxID=3055867 RepID=UPI0025A1C4A0|nr:GNAT family N-acetyltransferase [Bacillus sp. DX4.1]MDM5189066.1 GNAT family N-acetyltransferase [Bacillus sp. DX4.1]